MRVSVECREEEILVILRGDNAASPPFVVDQTSGFSIQSVAVCLVSREPQRRLALCHTPMSRFARFTYPRHCRNETSLS